MNELEKQLSAALIPTSKNYLFVNNARFLSMAAVVLRHSVEQATRVHGPHSLPTLCHLLLLFRGFGVIDFFLISGFLAGDRLYRGKPLQYLRQRVENVCLPWLFWCTIWSLFVVAVEFRDGRLTGDRMHHRIDLLFYLANITVFHSPFWFVPNLMLALCLLMILQRFLSERLLGGALLAISLFYGCNIYGKWVATGHTEALAGYIFYIWLGTWGARNLPAIQLWLSRIATQWVVLSTSSSLLAAIAESRYLQLHGVTDDINALRLTNQIYSLAFLLLLLKLTHAASPRFVNVRTTTFGIYLTHTLVLQLVASFFRKLTGFSQGGGYWRHELLSLAVSLAIFVATYATALLFVQFLNSWPKLSWTVGPNASTRQRKASAPLVLNPQAPSSATITA